MAVLAVRRLPALLLLPFLVGCLPYYRPDPGLERERDELRVQERGHPDAARYPQARYAVCEKLAGTLISESAPLPLSRWAQAGVRPEKAGTGTCCLGGLAFTADLLVVVPLRALRTVFTLPVAWGRRASLRREAEEARRRWMALDPQAGEKPTAEK